MSKRISGKHRRSAREHGQIEREICCNITVRREKATVRRVFYNMRKLRRSVYGQVPRNVPDKDKVWPDRVTDIKCWYCRNYFDTVPVPIVKQYDPVVGQYEVHGICCSFPCAKSYLRDDNASDNKVRLLYQRKLAIEVFGWAPDKPIPYAPAWMSLEDVGGYQEIDEFRETAVGETARVCAPPFVPFPILIECHKKDTVVEAAAQDPDAQREMENISTINLKGLRRPSNPIDTIDKLREAHPQHCRDNAVSDSIFQRYIDTEVLPTEEECQRVREERIATKRAKRKRKQPVDGGDTKKRAKKAKAKPEDKGGQPPAAKKRKTTKATKARKSQTPSYKAQTLLDFMS